MKLFDWFNNKNSLINENSKIKKGKKEIEQKYNNLLECLEEVNKKYVNLLEQKSEQFDLYVKYQKLCEEFSKDKKDLKKQLAETQKEWKNKQMNQLGNNIEYSYDWLIREIIKTDFEQKKTNQIQYVKMTKIDLLRLVQKFIKLNEKGE